MSFAAEPAPTGGVKVDGGETGIKHRERQGKTGHLSPHNQKPDYKQNRYQILIH